MNLVRNRANRVTPLCDTDRMVTSTETLIETPATPEQLALLTVTDPPLQFRLDQRTRERGLAHVAAIRAQLSALAAERQAA